MTAAEEDRSNVIIDDDSDEENDAAQSDIVRICLNLAYLTEKEAKGFRFDKMSYKNVRSQIADKTNQNQNTSLGNSNTDLSPQLL